MFKTEVGKLSTIYSNGFTRTVIKSPEQPKWGIAVGESELIKLVKKSDDVTVFVLFNNDLLDGCEKLRTEQSSVHLDIPIFSSGLR